ncbi:unnamed protein product, partial [Mesorhabditis belari]|uniref:Uncharacterized protein n=1 Tax=Mesorhabditis belari TaxID=2138241 RepID=A0AAF3FGS8_9BILA
MTSISIHLNHFPCSHLPEDLLNSVLDWVPYNEKLLFPKVNKAFRQNFLTFGPFGRDVHHIEITTSTYDTMWGGWGKELDKNHEYFWLKIVVFSKNRALANFCIDNEELELGRWRDIYSPVIERIPLRPAIDQPDSNVNKMGIFHCQIPKNGATIMKVIMCDLYRYFKGMPFKIKYEKDKSLSECQLEQWYKNLVATKYKADLWKTNPEATKIAVIRHPLKRFLSLYGYLCEQVNLCGVGTNIHKFTKDVYTLLSTRSVNGTLFKETNQAVLEYHAQPQTWFCNLSTDYQKFHLIHNAGDRLAMRLELQKAFDAAKVPKKYSDQVLFHIVYSDTVHANHDQNHTKNLKAYMEENPQTMAYFNAIYYKDFELLGY